MEMAKEKTLSITPEIEPMAGTLKQMVCITLILLKLPALCAHHVADLGDLHIGHWQSAPDARL
jgi:hypothetical protein